MNKRILVIGSMNMDMTVKLRALPKVGETVLAQEILYNLGGKGANQACAAARLGGNVKMLGCVGDDDFGKKQLAALKQLGVDVSEIRIVTGVSTGTAVVCVEESGSNCIMVEQGANFKCDETYMREVGETILESDFLLVQMEIPQESLFWAIRYAHAEGKCVVLNPAPAPETMPDDIYANIDYLIPNEIELLKLTGQELKAMNGQMGWEEIGKGAREILSQGVRTVIVTLGENGCGVFQKGWEEYYNGVAVDTVDTTGAGDCFAGAFVAGLAQGMTEAEAVQFALYASALSVTRQGAQASLPEKWEVERELQELKRMQA